MTAGSALSTIHGKDIFLSIYNLSTNASPYAFVDKLSKTIL